MSFESPFGIFQQSRIVLVKHWCAVPGGGQHDVLQHNHAVSQRWGGGQGLQTQHHQPDNEGAIGECQMLPVWSAPYRLSRAVFDKVLSMESANMFRPLFSSKVSVVLPDFRTGHSCHGLGGMISVPSLVCFWTRFLAGSQVEEGANVKELVPKRYDKEELHGESWREDLWLWERLWASHDPRRWRGFFGWEPMTYKYYRKWFSTILCVNSLELELGCDPRQLNGYSRNRPW